MKDRILEWLRKLRYGAVPRDPTKYTLSFKENLGVGDLTIVDIGQTTSFELRKQLEQSILTYGKPFLSGGVLGTEGVLGAGGLLGTFSSSLFAGNVFIASASPATLMSIGGGVGSQVVGASGQIIAQAPFISAGSIITPVLAPVMLFTTFSSIVISLRLDRIQDTLEKLSEVLKKMLVRELIGDYAQVISARDRIEDIKAALEGNFLFTDEMKNRLSLVERDIGVLQLKYEFLSEGGVASILDAQLSLPNMHLFILSSVADIEIESLRLKLALQDNPNEIDRTQKRINTKIEGHREQFKNLLENDSLKIFQDKMREDVEKIKKKKAADEFLLKAKEFNNKKKNIAESKKIMENDLYKETRSTLEELQQQLDSYDSNTGKAYSVVCYREQRGKGELKAYYTKDLKLQQSKEE